MRKINCNPSISILTIVLSGISAVLIGCGFFEDDNSQPSIQPLAGETITDQTLTLTVNSRRTVEVYITDADDDDTHMVSAFSENTTVATVSVADTTLTIRGIAAGSTTVTVTATDDSGHDNAAASLVYAVTVIEPKVVVSTPLPLTELSLNESVVTLTLVGLTYDRHAASFSSDAVTVSGIGDVRINRLSSGRISDTVIKVALIFSGNIDTDTTLTFTVAASAIAEYDGPPLTAQIPVVDAIDIQGPWLWMAVPTDPNVGGGVSTETDSLAEGSNGGITETDVAKKGVNEGDIIGQFQWRSGSIRNTHEECEEFCAATIFGGCATLCWLNNINVILNPLGFGTGGNIEAHTAYALINLVSPSNQDNAVMGVKSGDAIKIWLNGEVIHREAATGLECRSIDVPVAIDPWVCTPDPDSPKEFSIPVKLRDGDNLLLVKVRQHGDYWGMAVRLVADFTTAIPKR